MPVPSKLVSARDSLKKLTPSKLEKKLLELVRATEHLAVDLNTSQLMEGVDSLGDSLMAYQDPMYAAFKRTLNARGVTDLNLEGDFHDGFFVKSDKFPLEFSSKDEKTEMLVDKYGKEIFGLSKDNLNEYSEEIKRLYQAWFQSVLDRI